MHHATMATATTDSGSIDSGSEPMGFFARARIALMRSARIAVARLRFWHDSSATAPQPEADDDNGPGN